MAWRVKDDIPPRPSSIDDLIEGDLEEVTKLILMGKWLEVVPEDICRLTNLRVLELRFNRLTELPMSLRSLPNVRSLSVANNVFTVFPPVLLQLNALEALNLADNPLDTIPPELAGLMKLARLWLNDIAVEDLPVEIGNLPLKSFGLSVWTENTEAILRSLGGLISLTLSRIGPAAVEAALATLPSQLHDLTLEANGLTALPAAVGRMDLTSLQLWDQNLAEFPELRHMSSVENLTLGYCRLTKIPSWVGTLRNLQFLHLHSNQIHTLPRALADLSDEIDLNLDNNPLEPPLDDLAQQGTAALFAYLRTLPASDDESLASTLPEQRPAPLEAQIVEGRLTLSPAPASAEAMRRELAIMHAEVRKRAHKATTLIGDNHAPVLDLVRDYLDALGDDVGAMQGISLGFAGLDLQIHGAAYRDDDDGSDRLYPQQRAALDVLNAAHELLMRSVPEWQDYVLKSGAAPPIASQASDQAREIVGAIAQALRDQPKVADPNVPRALDEVARIAAHAPEPSVQLARHGLVDTGVNVLSLLAREAIRQIETEIPSEARKWTARAALGAVAYGIFNGKAAELLALGQSLPKDFGWLGHVIAAIRSWASSAH